MQKTLKRIEKFESLRAQGMTLKEAAAKMKVTPGAYYWWKRSVQGETSDKPKGKHKQKAKQETIVIHEPPTSTVFVFFGPEHALSKVMEKLNV